MAYTRDEVKGWVKTYRTLRDADKALGISGERVRQLVKQHKVGRRLSGEMFLVLFYGHLLGEMADLDVKRITGISSGTIANARRINNIPLFASGQNTIAQVKELASQGLNDINIGQKIGRDPSYIAHIRHTHSIRGRYSDKTGRGPNWSPKEDELLWRMNDQAVAIIRGTARLSPWKRRRSAGIPRFPVIKKAVESAVMGDWLWLSACS